MPHKSVILGHIHSGMGEKTHCFKLQRLLECPILDIFDLFQEDYEPLAQLNYNLADSDFPILESLNLPSFQEMRKKLPEADTLFLLSWNFSVAAAFAAGLHCNRKVIAKLYAHHENERILPKLYEPASVLITESLLANGRALAYGIKPEKVIFLPHYYPPECENLRPSRRYVHALAKEQGKKIGTNTQVIGTVARLEIGKNCEFSIQAVKHLAAKGKDVVLVLKGNFSNETAYPEYQTKLRQMVEEVRHEPWFLWDSKHTPFPDVLEEYMSFDVLLHLSGAEAGSHIVTESLGLKKPVIVLNCSTNPYLFKGLATFVKTTGTLYPAQLPFFIPDWDDLLLKLEEPLSKPDFSMVQKRFHVESTKWRLHLALNSNTETVKKLYDDDRKLFYV